MLTVSFHCDFFFPERCERFILIYLLDKSQEFRYSQCSLYGSYVCYLPGINLIVILWGHRIRLYQKHTEFYLGRCPRSIHYRVLKRILIGSTVRQCNTLMHKHWVFIGLLSVMAL